MNAAQRSGRAANAAGATGTSLLSLHLRPWVPLLLLALVLRLATVPLQSFHHPDEIFQYIEQAHRLVMGYGVIPWEYRAGIRNWLIPLLISWPIWLTEALGFTGPAYIPVIRTFVALLSLSIVLAFYAIGRSISLTHAIVAGFVGAVWFELVHFATHPLSETLSLVLFAPAAALLKDAERKAFKALFLAGLLLGIAVLVRYQIVVAAGLLALLTCGFRFRASWLPVIAGGLVALALGAIVDLAMGMTPFGWAFSNFTINIIEGRSEIYGVSGPFYYISTVAAMWQTTTLLIAPLALIGARRYPALFIAAAAHLLAHSLVGHKEYRFIILSTSVAVLLASLGAADVLKWTWQNLSAPGRRLLLTGSLVFCFLTSLMLAAGDRYRFQWTRGGPALAAIEAAGRIPNVCGVALLDTRFWETGGYSHLHRRVPIYPIDTKIEPKEALHRSSSAFNVILVRSDREQNVPPGFSRHTCASQIGGRRPYDMTESLSTCVHVRPGPCAPALDRPQINDFLVRINE